jgi:hypothetical protein
VFLEKYKDCMMAIRKGFLKRSFLRESTTMIDDSVTKEVQYHENLGLQTLGRFRNGVKALRYRFG